MEILVKLSRTDKTKKINLKKGSTIIELLKKIDIKPDTVIVMKENKPIAIDEELNKEQELEIIQVSSGG